jgi:hypothetical protein
MTFKKQMQLAIHPLQEESGDGTNTSKTSTDVEGVGSAGVDGRGNWRAGRRSIGPDGGSRGGAGASWGSPGGETSNWGGGGSLAVKTDWSVHGHRDIITQGKSHLQEVEVLVHTGTEMVKGPSVRVKVVAPVQV